MDFKTVYRTEDGTTFETKAEAEAYVKLMETPHVKKLVARIDELESEMAAMRAEIACMKRPPAIDPSNPFQRPQVWWGQQAYNPATGEKL